MHVALVERLSQAVEKTWRIEQLEEANRAYNEMLGFVAHELKNPVASMITQGKMLQQGIWGELEEKHEEIVGRLVSRAQHLLDLTKEYLDLARVEAGEDSLDASQFDFIETVVQPALEMVEPDVQQRDAKVTTDHPPHLQVEGEPTTLKVVLGNLLGNAVKYGNEGGKVQVSVDGTDSKVRVSVWNEGPGFSEEMKGKLFKKFSRLPKRELVTRKGSGVGLYVSWKIIQKHGGRIWADSEEGKWARFSFEIPIYQEQADG